VLLRVHGEEAYADRAFRAEADRSGLDARDRAFAQRLAYGTIQRRRTLEFVLEALTSRPLGDVDPPVLDALRLGVFQLLWMDSVPDRAAVDQTVELVKAASPRAAGFANAVMRRAAHEAETRVAELPPESPIALSHPDWLAEMWRSAIGEREAVALMAHDNEPAESALRANALRATVEEVQAALLERGVESTPAPLVPEALVVSGAFDAHGSDLFERGWLMPQSRGSMLVARVLGPRPGERVLDMCAAPGAKATQLAALMEGRGQVVAVEANVGRARELGETVRRMGADIVEVREADAREPIERAGFDRILLDAPCTDLGTLQSRPDARWRKDPETIVELARLQRELLDAASLQLRPGGTLVYSTCTISEAENERQVEAFLADRPELEADDLGAEQPDLARAGAARFLQLFPHRDRTDGFFIARMRRAG